MRDNNTAINAKRPTFSNGLLKAVNDLDIKVFQI